MAKFLTKGALEGFKKELEDLKNVKRKEISERIRYAAAFGDLKENFAYHEAKEAQGFLEMRIRELEQMISQARIITKNGDGTAGLGSVVTISNGDENEEYQLVEPEESDIIKGKISIKSPLGINIKGKGVGDSFEIVMPDGRVKYKIIKIN